MILCFLAIGGFLYWLSVTAEPTEVVVEEEPEEDVAVNVVAFADFSAGTSSYIGEEITLEGISVSSLLGPQGAWTSLENGTPYLLRFMESALADSVEIVSGGSINVTGSVVAMSDSILDAWEAVGGFPQAGDRMQAEFALDFIEVISVSDAQGGSDDSSS
ncbi:MAG: hypothetical protein OXK77_10020 [Gemmatimonadota bacterium]|nr:hypothetical protein [Gemmatimonadota bacterium]MDE2863672.1 hypothetical protein [Gemmatimonadota bacterium]